MSKETSKTEVKEEVKNINLSSETESKSTEKEAITPIKKSTEYVKRITAIKKTAVIKQRVQVRSSEDRVTGLQTTENEFSAKYSVMIYNDETERLVQKISFSCPLVLKLDKAELKTVKPIFREVIHYEEGDVMHFGMSDEGAEGTEAQSEFDWGFFVGWADI
jgi:hypothetical protein